MRKKVESVLVRTLEKELGRFPTAKELDEAMKKVEGSLMFPDYEQSRELGEMMKNVSRLENKVETYKREIKRLKEEIKFYRVLEGC